MFGGSISAGAFSKGKAGNVLLSATQLKIVEGGSITSSTIGSGDGGQVDISADSIIVSGRVSIDRSNIAAVSFGSGNAGDLNISTKQLQVTNQALVNTSSRATGDAGSVFINASDSVEIGGTNKNFKSAIRAGIEITNPEARKIFGLPDVPSGNAGDVTINSPVVNVIQEGIVSVSNEGTGAAGILSVDARKINLLGRGSITATSASGSGGNISLNTNTLQLDENSQITATATLEKGDGGNITINTNSLIAKKNSQVTANAFAGRGGNLEINTEGLFLFDSPENIFSASSEFGIDGAIEIETPDVNLQQELEQSEIEILPTKEAIANSCLARSRQQGSFTISNSEGLPKNPNSNYSDINFSLTGVSLPLSETRQSSETQQEDLQMLTSSALPAQRMVKTRTGRIFLVAAPQNVESVYCQTKVKEIAK